jgi:glycosyltransferase involved in cell wall biosynthesis
MSPSVLFVSKPIAPPFHDGSKCLVRDVARNLTRVDPVVLSIPGAPPISSAPGARSVRLVSAYATPGSFTPALAANVRAASWVLLRSRASVWHFVFAPNVRTSNAGRKLSRLRRVPVVQTVASPPRSFEHPERLFFGDIVVAQSAWTRHAIEMSYEASGARPPRLLVIPPPVPELVAPTPSEIAAARAALGLSETQRYVIYPGDLETSSGAETTAALAERFTSNAPDLLTVFAYRRKSARAAEIAAQLSARLSGARACFAENVPSILALLAGAEAVLFPVDDLWGKVDLPIVLLEAMALGTPVIILDRGPLTDLSGVIRVPNLELPAWERQVAALVSNPAQREIVGSRQRRALAARHSAASVARAYEDLYLELALTRQKSG